MQWYCLAARDRHGGHRPTRSGTHMPTRSIDAQPSPAAQAGTLLFGTAAVFRRWPRFPAYRWTPAHPIDSSLCRRTAHLHLLVHLPALALASWPPPLCVCPDPHACVCVACVRQVSGQLLVSVGVAMCFFSVGLPTPSVPCRFQ